MSERGIINAVIVAIFVALVLGGFYVAMRNQTQKLEDGARAEQDKTVVKNGAHRITLETNFGKIIFETYDADAPKTVQNFISLADKGFYNNLTFHRIIKGFMIQGGDPQGNGTGGPGYRFDDELNPETQSYKAGYKKGVVAMANAGPNTNGSQFFINVAPNNFLDTRHVVFGKVVSGMEVVEKIENTPTLLPGVADRPATPVIIESISFK